MTPSTRVTSFAEHKAQQPRPSGTPSPDATDEAAVCCSGGLSHAIPYLTAFPLFPRSLANAELARMNAVGPLRHSLVPRRRGRYRDVNTANRGHSQQCVDDLD